MLYKLLYASADVDIVEAKVFPKCYAGVLVHFLNVLLGAMENRVSSRAESLQVGQPSCHQREQAQQISEHTQDPWSGISSIGLFAPSNVQTYEPFPEAESAKKKKKKRRKGFSL